MTAATVTNSGNARVGIVLAVREDAALAMHNRVYAVVAAGDAGVHLVLRQLQLVLAKLRIVQQVEKHLEDGVEVALQAIERDRWSSRLGRRFQSLRRAPPGSRPSGRRSSFRPAGAPDVTVEIDQPGLLAGSYAEPPRIRAVAVIKGSSWSGCRKMTMPFGNCTRVGCCGWNAGSGGA